MHPQRASTHCRRETGTRGPSFARRTFSEGRRWTRLLETEQLLSNLLRNCVSARVQQLKGPSLPASLITRPPRLLPPPSDPPWDGGSGVRRKWEEGDGGREGGPGWLRTCRRGWEREFRRVTKDPVGGRTNLDIRLLLHHRRLTVLTRLLFFALATPTWPLDEHLKLQVPTCRLHV